MPAVNQAGGSPRDASVDPSAEAPTKPGLAAIRERVQRRRSSVESLMAVSTAVPSAGTQEIRGWGEGGGEEGAVREAAKGTRWKRAGEELHCSR